MKHNARGECIRTERIFGSKYKKSVPDFEMAAARAPWLPEKVFLFPI